MLDYFIERYPHIKNMADIRFMNENAPLQASNLNNPCQHMREDVMARSSSQHLKEASQVEGLTPEVRTKRAAASARIHAQSLQLETDSYDFFNAHHPRSNRIEIGVSPIQNLVDLTGTDSDGEDQGIDGAFVDGDLSVMNDSVAGMLIGGPKTPKQAWPSSQTHNRDDVDRPVCMLVCIALAETDEAFLTGINNYMKGAITDAPSSIRSFACHSDRQHPQEKSVFFEVPSEQMARALMPHLQQMGGQIERKMPTPPTSKHDLFSPGIRSPPTALPASAE